VFYVDEKKQVIRQYDLQKAQFSAHVINCQRNGGKFPVFAGIGSVENRLFVFGGKDSKTKAISSRAVEIVWNQDDDVMDLVPVGRMFA
jgi:hypothetical protein